MQGHNRTSAFQQAAKPPIGASSAGLNSGAIP